MHSNYADLSNVTRDMFPIIPHGVRVETNSSLGQDVVGWRKSKTTTEIVRERVVVGMFVQRNNRLLLGDNPALDTTKTEND